MSERLRSSHLTTRVRAVRALSYADWAVLLRAWAWLIVLDVASALLPDRFLMSFLLRNRSAPRGTKTALDPARLQYLVCAAAAHVWPTPGCLSRAVVLRAVLEAHGAVAELVVGVAKSADSFAAHAWVEHRGCLLDAANVASRYVPLCRLGRAPMAESGS